MLKKEFRIWDTEEKKWYAPTFEAYRGQLFELLLTTAGELIERTLKEFRHESCFQGKYIINQWTGLYDKKNNKIFEKDILKYYHQNTNLVVEDFYTIGSQLWGDNTWSDNEPNSALEIIGNIYENPELVK